MSCEQLVFTWFFPNRPGWLDFRYRVQSCLNHFDTHVVSNLERARVELGVPESRFTHLPGSGGGLKGMLQYRALMNDLIKDFEPRNVVLLSSHFSAMAWSLRAGNYSLYWNEHPTHRYPEVSQYGLSWLKNWLMLKACYLSACRANPVMPISEFQVEDLLDHQVPEDRVSFIPMGVDESFLLNPDEIPSAKTGPLSVIYTGTVKRDRGRDVMLEALPIVKAAGGDIVLKLVGATPDQIDYCNRKAADLGVVEMVSVQGRVPGSEISNLLKRADAGVCIWADKPFWRFNPPTKLFEYLAAGLPILASNIRTHTHYVEEGETGLIFDYTAESFAAALIRLVELRNSLPEMSRRAVGEGARYSWAHLEEEYLAAMRRSD